MGYVSSTFRHFVSVMSERFVESREGHLVLESLARRLSLVVWLMVPIAENVLQSCESYVSGAMRSVCVIISLMCFCFGFGMAILCEGQRAWSCGYQRTAVMSVSMLDFFL